MASDTIRASEVGNYLYCRRSWWYQRQGVRSANTEQLARGDAAHAAYGREAQQAQRLRGLAFVLILIAAILTWLQFIG